GIGAELGKARLVGAMSVPPTWAGSMPRGLSSAAMAGLGGLPTAAELAQAAGAAGTGGMPMMPMPMGAGGAGAGMPAAMMGRGGANPHVVQSRPSVIPRTGVG
ncbi:PPE family protein, SVP subgroup, partial [Mycobacterium gastri]|uniref:PPE family protein, SVP subgroup n=1 Tax=Mycobacterium gastri TaxID=1777 RepID=UPI003CC5A07F